MKHIRLVDEKDIETILEIRTSVKENYYSRLELVRMGIIPETIYDMLCTSCKAWICFIDDEAVGFSMADKNTGSVYALFVKPQFESQGIGRELLKYSEEWLFSEGHKEIWLETDKNLKIRAHGFYYKMGWKKDGLTEKDQIRYKKFKKD